MPEEKCFQTQITQSVFVQRETFVEFNILHAKIQVRCYVFFIWGRINKIYNNIFPGLNKVTITPCILVNTAFSISGTVMNEVASTGTDVGSACANDWITIPCATNSFKQDKQITGDNSMGPETCVDRICGMVFNSVIQDEIATARTQPVNSKYPVQLITVQIR